MSPHSCLIPQASVKQIFCFHYNRFCHFTTGITSLPCHILPETLHLSKALLPWISGPYWATTNTQGTGLGSRATVSWCSRRKAGWWSPTMPHFSQQLSSTAQCFTPLAKEDPQRNLQVYLPQPSPSRALSWAGQGAGFCQQQGSGCARTPSHHADSSASLFPPAAICFSCLILRWQSCCEAAHHLPSCSHSTYQQHGTLCPKQGPEVLQ